MALYKAKIISKRIVKELRWKKTFQLKHSYKVEVPLTLSISTQRGSAHKIGEDKRLIDP